MAVFKSLSDNDISTAKSFSTQLIDIIQEDISGSSTRRSYQQFITGGSGPGITSSLWQTVYDQAFTLQTANPLFDITVGLSAQSTLVTLNQTGVDANGKLLFPSNTVMMREKVENYQQMAQVLLGDSSSEFTIQQTSGTVTIRQPMFVSFKRLFSRDGIKRETFAMKFYSGSASTVLNLSSSATTEGQLIFSDISSSINKTVGFGGNYGTIVEASNTANAVGVMYYDRGVAVFDLSRITNQSQVLVGTIKAVVPAGYTTWISGDNKHINDLLVSASIDDVVNHLCYTRFQSGTLTAMTFQNLTTINSTIIRCSMDLDEFNYSSNPTFTDSNNRIIVIDEGQEETQQTFTYVSGIGLYNANDDLLAVAKVSRPILKDPTRALQILLRLDV